MGTACFLLRDGTMNMCACSNQSILVPGLDGGSCSDTVYGVIVAAALARGSREETTTYMEGTCVVSILHLASPRRATCSPTASSYASPLLGCSSWAPLLDASVASRAVATNLMFSTNYYQMNEQRHQSVLR